MWGRERGRGEEERKKRESEVENESRNRHTFSLLLFIFLGLLPLTSPLILPPSPLFFLFPFLFFLTLSQLYVQVFIIYSFGNERSKYEKGKKGW